MFSERLKMLRTEKNLTQGQLAQELGISNKSISVYEKGASTPTLDTLEKIASFFNVTVDYLIGYSDERNPKIDSISAELNVSSKAIDALILLSESKNGSSIISSLLENDNFISFLSYIAVYLSHTESDIDKMVHNVFDDFPEPLPQLSYNDKYSLMLTTIKTQAIGFLEKALDDLTSSKPSTSE